MRIVCSGASGLLGTALRQALTDDGHDVVQLVRHAPSGADEVQWDPSSGSVDSAVLAGADAVVNLSGAGIAGKRWTSSYKKTLVSSRVEPTRTLARAIAGLGDRAPAVFLSAAAVGYYGDTGDRITDETGPKGEGFLADLVETWEAETQPAAESGHTRVTTLRTGLVLSPKGGLLAPLKLVFGVGLGGKLGSGRQYQPWISMRDEIRAMQHLLVTDVAGPVNLVGPEPVRQAEFAAHLAKIMHRPALFPTPAFAIRLVLDGFADEGILIGQRAVPSALVASGFTFADDSLDGALREALDPS